MNGQCCLSRWLSWTSSGKPRRRQRAPPKFLFLLRVVGIRQFSFRKFLRTPVVNFNAILDAPPNSRTPCSSSPTASRHQIRTPLAVPHDVLAIPQHIFNDLAVPKYRQSQRPLLAQAYPSVHHPSGPAAASNHFVGTTTNVAEPGAVNTQHAQRIRLIDAYSQSPFSDTRPPPAAHTRPSVMTSYQEETLKTANKTANLATTTTTTKTIMTTLIARGCAASPPPRQ